MLQKYQPNPLSHFLALQNSQVTHHNVVDAHTLASTLVNGHAQFQHQHHNQQQQHASSGFLANHHPHITHNYTAIELAAQHLNSHNSPTHIQREHQHHHQNQQHHHQQTHHTNNQLHHHHSHRNSQNHHHSHLHHHHHHNHQRAQQLIEAAAAVTANTTLDAGKSFTIAAILGLQKNALENTRKEYTNNVINLSLNGASHHHPHYEAINSSIQQPPTDNTPPSDVDDEPPHQHPQRTQRNSPNSNNNNNNNNNNRDVSNLNGNKSNICNSFNATAASSSNNNNNNNNNNNSTSSCNSSDNASYNKNRNTTITTTSSTATVNNTVNTFNCDNSNATAATAASVLMNRYLPSAMASVSGSNVVPTTPSLVSFASSPLVAHQQHARANSFVAVAAAAAAAAAANGAPSALQSLQQLHQQHAHQTSLSFHRDKLKADHNSKKSSLKNKRVRTIFTPEQLERLEAEFERQQYMVGPERLYLAHTLQLTEAQVKVWFQNRRIKWRKHHLEITQQRLALLRQTQIATSTTNNGNTETANINIDTNDDECDDIKREELRELNESRQDTESELSICNDSIDAESILEGDDET